MWVKDKDDVYVTGTALRMEKGVGLIVKITGTGVEKACDLSKGDVLPANKTEANDMCALGHINEATILQCLEDRIKKQDKNDISGECYTYMANVLLAVNPLKRGMTDPSMDSFIGAAERNPHPYATAETAFKQMITKLEPDAITNQSVVISGESGAGKTESAKIVLRHLCYRGGSDAGVDKKLLETNPILEAFGNGKTTRNANSSRFGKYMKLQFTDDKKHNLVGGMIETYLLEKSRVAFQVKDERNYHVFYMVFESAEAASFGLSTPADYGYLNKSGCLTSEGWNDADEYKLMIGALEAIQATADQILTLKSLIAGILHLGNVNYNEESTPEGDIAVVEKQEVLDAAAKCFGVEAEHLRKVMCEKETKIMGELIVVQRNATAARYARNAVAKEMYSRCFDWIIEQCNIALQEGDKSLPYVGVLDIFGFETFKRNDFEQLLINFTNEVLQATFNQQVFIAEADLYRQEGIAVAPVQWPDNRECVELVAAKPGGILTLLDNESGNPKPSDLKFNASIHKQHQHNPYAPKPHPKDIKNVFNVKHFAGKVTYTVGNFIEKNNNSIPPDVGALFEVSKMTSLSVKCGAAMAPPKRGKKAPTVGGIFKKQMDSLVQTLNITKCSFIRCVKPNATSEFGVFDRNYTITQLRCQGIIETVEVLKMGLPTRLPYKQIADQFRGNLPADIMEMFENESDLSFCTAIMWAFEVPQDAYKCGVTKIFFRVGKMSLLEEVLNIDWSTKGVEITKRLKRFVIRKRWRRALACVIAQNRFVKHFHKIQKSRQGAITKLQSLFRGKKGRAEAKVVKENELERRRKEAEEARKKAEEAEKKRQEELEKKKLAEIAKKEAEEAAKKQAELEKAAEAAAMAAEAERKKIAAQEEAMRKDSKAQASFEDRRKALQEANTKMAEKKKDQEISKEKKKVAEAEAIKFDAEVKKAKAEEASLEKEEKGMSAFEERRKKLMAAQNKVKELEDKERAAKSAREAAERETMLFEAEMKALTASAEYAEKEANEKSTFEDRRAALQKAKEANEESEKAVKGIQSQAAESKKIDDDWFAMASRMEEEAEGQWIELEDFWKECEKEVETAEAAEEEARKDAEDAWYKSQDEKGAEKEEDAFWEQQKDDVYDPWAMMEKGDLWDDVEPVEEDPFGGFFDFGGPQNDDEIFLLALLASMGACQIAPEASGEGGAAAIGDDGEEMSEIDRVLEAAFSALSMRQEERDAMNGAEGEDEMAGAMQGMFGSMWDADEEESEDEESGLSGDIFCAAPRRLSRAGSIRGSILSPPPRRLSAAQGRARASMVLKKKRRSTKSLGNPTTEKGKQMMRVNEMVADGKISMEQAERMHEDIMSSPDGTPFPSIPTDIGGEKVDAGELEQAENDFSDMEMPPWLQPDWKPEVISGEAEMPDWLLDMNQGTHEDQPAFNDQMWWSLPPGVLDDDTFWQDDDEAGGGHEDALEDYDDDFGNAAEELDMQWMDLPDDLQESTPMTDYKGGTLCVSMYGCMQQYDLETLAEFTEYVILCSWGPDADTTEQWLVFTRFEEFRDCHKSLRKRLNPMIASHLSYPHFPRRNLVAGTKPERLEMRLRGLQGYISDLFSLMDQQHPIKDHLDEADDFLALSEHITAIRKSNLMRVEEVAQIDQGGGQKRGRDEVDEEEEEEAPDNGHMPMNLEELQQSQGNIQQLWRLIINSQQDVREDYNIQQLLHIVMGSVPRLMASVELGPFTSYQLIPMAEQNLYDLQEVIALYNDEALLYQIGASGMFDSAGIEEMFGGLGMYGEMGEEAMNMI
jgi:myosin heavy subunit